MEGAARLKKSVVVKATDSVAVSDIVSAENRDYFYVVTDDHRMQMRTRRWRQQHGEVANGCNAGYFETSAISAEPDVSRQCISWCLDLTL